MAKEDKSEKVAEKAAPVEKPAAPKSKADAIRASKLPEHKKNEYLAQIGEGPKAIADDAKISLDVYVQLAGIRPDHKAALLAYPKAKGVKSATLAEWKEIFKGF